MQNVPLQKVRHLAATDHDEPVTFVQEKDEHVVISKSFKDFLRSNQRYILGRRVESLERVILRLLSDDATAEFAAFKLTRSSEEKETPASEADRLPKRRQFPA